MFSGTTRSPLVCQPALSISTIPCVPGATAWPSSARNRFIVAVSSRVIAALPPDIAGPPLLPDPRLVLAPDFKPLGFWMRLRDFRQAGGKPPYMRRPVSTLIGSSAVRRLNEFGIGLAWSVCGEAPHHLISGRARIGAGTHIPHAWGSRAVEADGTHLFDGDQSPGGCRSTSFPVRRRQPVEDAASKLA